MSRIKEIAAFLEDCSEIERRWIFNFLRKKYQIHPIEKKLNVSAEVILEAIDRASDLTIRGIRGIIAEASFKQNVLQSMDDWVDETKPGDAPYDFLLVKGSKKIRIQVKMQRLKSHRPMTANEGYRILSADKFVVETQRTRGGKDKKSNSDTRPYRFGEFDILAVSMQPSTGNWRDFQYTVSSWLIPRKENQKLLLKFQPVPKRPSDEWTDSLPLCIDWFLSGKKNRIDL
jgi:hypothetical protein